MTSRPQATFVSNLRKYIVSYAGDIDTQVYVALNTSNRVNIMVATVHQKDKGYAWIVCMASFLIYLICDGIGMAFGVLVPCIRKDLNTSSATAAFIGSLHIGISYMSAPINTTMAQMVGYRTMSVSGAVIVTGALVACGFSTTPTMLMIFYGVMAGIGICMIITTAELCVNHNFDQKRALANGIVFSGSSIGYFLSAPILTYILDNHGLQATFLAQGGITSSCFVLGLLLKTPKRESDENTKPDSEDKINGSFFKKISLFLQTMIDKQVVCNRGFVMYSIARVFNYLALMVPLLYIPSLALESQGNFTPVQASFAITILGISNLCGRLLCGLSDKFPSQVIKINVFTSIGSGITLALIPHCITIPSMYAASAAYGLLSASMVALSPSTLVLLVGTESIGSALGLNMFIYGVMSLIGPPLIGTLIDHYQTYTYPFYFAAASFGISSIFHFYSDRSDLHELK